MTVRRAKKSHLRATRACTSVMCAVLPLITACTVPVAVGLDEQQANRITAALAESGIAADKLPDPDSERKWRIDVLGDDAPRAVSLLSEENLPRARSPGLLDAVDSRALVPSRSDDHRRFVAGVAGELEKTLGGVVGVIDARVHLAVAPNDSLSDAQPAPPSASVLIRYRGERLPMPSGDIQRLVAGAVPGLVPERVAVVESAAPAAPKADALVHLGPFTTTRSSAHKLRLVLGGAAVLNVLLVLFVGVLWNRLRGERKPAQDPTPAPEAR